MKVAVILVIAIIIVCIQSALEKDRKRKEAQEREECERFVKSLAPYATFHNHTLSLKERRPELAKAIRIVDFQDRVITYTPEKYIYTSATVGGITTGGVEKVGGYSSETVRTGQVNLKWGLSVLNDISRIRLTDELFKKAKSKLNKEWLDEKKKEIIVEEDKAAYAALSLNMSDEFAKSIIKAGYPSYQKAIEILNWICGIE